MTDKNETKKQKTKTLVLLADERRERERRVHEWCGSCERSNALILLLPLSRNKGFSGKHIIVGVSVNEPNRERVHLNVCGCAELQLHHRLVRPPISFLGGCRSS